MESFDVIVIGAGSGLTISAGASRQGLKVAVVEEGPMGGTCLNRGCIPSKMIIHSADVVETVQRAHLFGIRAKVLGIDFKKVTQRASKLVDADAREIEAGIRSDKHTTLFKSRGTFIGPRTLQVGKKVIKGEKVVIAAGARPSIPPIKGLEDVDYLTSKEALRLTKKPKVLTIVGGGYIAAELAHFYDKMGTKVQIVQRNVRLVPDEDEEIAAQFTKLFAKRCTVLLAHIVAKVSQRGKRILVVAQEKNGTKTQALSSDALLIATGVQPNSDLLNLEATGVKTSEQGFIKVNEYMETTAKNIWALGDIVGIYLFKHSANLEAQIVYRNMFGQKEKVDYTAMPHAIFSSPQIAGVGWTEQALKEKKIPYKVKRYEYINTGMGKALEEETGFVKVLLEPGTRKILGCHILGTDASTLIHEVLVTMKMGGTAESLARTVHIHPALSEVVQRAFL